MKIKKIELKFYSIEMETLYFIKMAIKMFMVS